MGGQGSSGGMCVWSPVPLLDKLLADRMCSRFCLGAVGLAEGRWARLPHMLPTPQPRNQHRPSGGLREPVVGRRQQRPLELGRDRLWQHAGRLQGLLGPEPPGAWGLGKTVLNVAAGAGREAAARAGAAWRGCRGAGAGRRRPSCPRRPSRPMPEPRDPGPVQPTDLLPCLLPYSLQDVPRTLAHMLSGMHTGGGVAWVGVLCSWYGNPSSNLGYGYTGELSGEFNWNELQVRRGRLQGGCQMGATCCEPSRWPSLGDASRDVPSSAPCRPATLLPWCGTSAP